MQTLARSVCIVVGVLMLGVCVIEARERTFVAGKGVRFKVDVPAGYSFKNQTLENGLVLVEMENPAWRIAVNVLISPEHTAETETEEWQRNLVISRSAEFLAQSKEQDYKFFSLKPAKGSGVYCIFTDPVAKGVDELRPNEFMHAVVGAKTIRGAVMYFQILNNDLKSPEFQEIFDLFVNYFDAK